jgi:hypothetical protein
MSINKNNYGSSINSNREDDYIGASEKDFGS